MKKFNRGFYVFSKGAISVDAELGEFVAHQIIALSAVIAMTAVHVDICGDAVAFFISHVIFSDFSHDA
jgi:hypothetical protein